MSKHSSRGPEWDRVRKQVLVRDSYQCRLRLDVCTGTATTVDHVTSRNRGGTDDPSNLLAACSECNNKKSDKTITRKTWLNPRYFVNN